MNGWDNYPPDNDKSIAAFVIRAREWRNYVHHTKPEIIDQQTFDDKWLEGTKIIQGLNYVNYDARQLKTISLDPKHQLVLTSLNLYIARLTQNLSAISAAMSNLQQKQTGDSAAISDLQQKQTGDSDAIKNLNQKQRGHSIAFSLLKKQVGKINEEVGNLSKITVKSSRGTYSLSSLMLYKV